MISNSVKRKVQSLILVLATVAAALSFTDYSGTGKVQASGNVCMIKNGSSEKLYESIDAALNEAGDSDTITMIADTSAYISVDSGKKVCIDLNRYESRGRFTLSHG